VRAFASAPPCNRRTAPRRRAPVPGSTRSQTDQGRTSASVARPFGRANPIFMPFPGRFLMSTDPRHPCTDFSLPMRSRRKKRSAEARGYGDAHRAVGRRIAPLVARGLAVCSRCGEPIIGPVTGGRRNRAPNLGGGNRLSSSRSGSGRHLQLAQNEKRRAALFTPRLTPTIALRFSSRYNDDGHDRVLRRPVILIVEIRISRTLRPISSSVWQRGRGWRVGWKRAGPVASHPPCPPAAGSPPLPFLAPVRLS
jgi:hypothetical protein